MDNKEVYQKKIEAQLEELKAEIERIKARVKKADADTRIEYNGYMEDLRLKHKAVQAKLKELKGAGEDSLVDIKAGVELAWDSLLEAVKSAGSRFK